jgi:hypothetical protein
MRQRNFLIGIFILALSMSGWGGALAAALCAHDAAQPSAMMMEDHDCCRAKLEPETEHCAAARPAPSTHEEMAMSEMAEAAPTATGQAHATVAAVELALKEAALCLHCTSRNGLPTTLVVTREPEQKKREASIAAPQVLKPTLSYAASFAPVLTARQNAPPIADAPRHLLLNVFVI